MPKGWQLNNYIVVIKGGGDIATGIAYRLFNVGFKIIITELPKPTVIRRSVAFADAVFKGSCKVQGVKAKRVKSIKEAISLFGKNEIPIIIDPTADIVNNVRTDVLVDAIIAKRNTGTKITDAPLVIGVGPGFTAGIDVHAVVESNRGHNLGRVIFKGQAEPDSAIPGKIDGFGIERVLRAPCSGKIRCIKKIGDIVKKDEFIAYVNEIPVRTQISGVVRGIIRDGFYVKENMKIGDVDPRAEVDHCFTISDKSLAIGGGVLEAVLYFLRTKRRTKNGKRDNKT